MSVPNNMPSDIASNVSETDVRVFAELSNPSKINLLRLRSEVNQADRERPALRAVDEDEEDDDENSEHSGEDDDSAEGEHSVCSDRGQNRASSGESDHSDTRRRSSQAGSESDDTDSPPDHHPTNRPVPSVVSSAHRSTAASTAHSTYTPQHPFYEQLSHGHSDGPGGLSVPSKTTGVFEEEEELLEKQQVLLDMERLKLQGIQLSKNWTVNDRLDDMQFEVRRHLMHVDEQNNISMMRDGMKLACTALEMGSQRFNILELNGWSAEVCSDMKRYDHALGRLYRKYWKKGFSNSPEMELAFALVGSAGMFHFKKKMTRQMVGGATQGMNADRWAVGNLGAAARHARDEDSDEEGPP